MRALPISLFAFLFLAPFAFAKPSEQLRCLGLHPITGVQVKVDIYNPALPEGSVVEVGGDCRFFPMNCGSYVVGKPSGERNNEFPLELRHGEDRGALGLVTTINGIYLYELGSPSKRQRLNCKI